MSNFGSTNKDPGDGSHAELLAYARPQNRDIGQLIASIVANPRFVRWCVIVVGAACAVIAIVAWQHYNVLDRSTVAIHSQSRSFQDGRQIELAVGMNAHHHVLFVCVAYQSLTDAERGTRMGLSVPSPLLGMRSSVQTIAKEPPDPVNSGLWIDGQKRVLGKGFVFVFVSDRVPACEIAIKESEQVALVQDANTMELLEFIQKWIVPRLPGQMER